MRGVKEEMPEGVSVVWLGIECRPTAFPGKARTGSFNTSSESAPVYINRLITVLIIFFDNLNDI